MRRDAPSLPFLREGNIREKGMKPVFEKIFQLSKHKTNVKTEVMAGITTFMTMAYILAVNPSILSAAGMDSTAVLLATALSSFIGTACMGLMANLPFALSAGMGLNAFLAYTVVLGMGYTWQVALLAVFVEGLIFVVLSLTNVREAIFNAIPLTLKRGVSVGIGLFICFIGLQNAGLAVDSATLVTITQEEPYLQGDVRPELERSGEEAVDMQALVRATQDFFASFAAAQRRTAFFTGRGR